MVWTIKELAGMSGGRPANKPDAVVRGFKSAHEASEGDLAFVTSSVWLEILKPNVAAVVPPDLEKDAGDRPLIVADNPRLAYAKILATALDVETPAPGVDPSAKVDPTATVSAEAHVGPFAFVGRGANIAARVAIHPGAYIGANAEIGEGSVVHPNAYVGHGCKIGARVVIGPGAVIGFDGFGYQFDGSKHVKIPQVGIVVIEDDVEVGALAAIDRATLGETRIGAGTKIDNLVQIGHNCSIGKNAIIVSQVGLAGSVEVGDMAVLAGQVGVADGVKIGAGAILGGKAGAHLDIKPGTRMGGFPARPISQWFRIEAVIDKLPELLKKVRRLEKRIEDLDKGKE